MPYRPDIDGLRGVAVVSVVAFHAFPSQLKGGFVGVDVFFVISGFLISSIIIGELQGETFSISRFYARRIKRIFPALLLVLAVCCGFGWFTLMADEYKQLGDHVAAGAGFFSNFTIWSESGYFDNAAQTKPLLHLWSLGIEEQFYIAWPFLLWAAYKRRINLALAIILLGALSFAFNLWVVGRDAVSAFYSPQARVWELLIGALLAYAALNKAAAGNSVRQNARRHGQGFFGVALIGFSIYALTKDSVFPGWWAVAPTIGTALVISAGPGAWLNRTVLSNPVLKWFGLISFPLYLWHWPLLTFLHMIQGATLGAQTRLAAVVAAVVLAWLTYMLIERPVRFGRLTNWASIPIALLMVIVGSAGFLVHKADGLPLRPHLVKAQERMELLEGPFWKYTTNKICEDRYPAAFRYFCIQSRPEPPTLILLGDSYANSLYRGLINNDRLTAQNVLSYGSCTPTVLTLDENVRKNCEVQHRIIETTRSLRFAMLSSRWPRFDADGRYADYFTGKALPDEEGNAAAYMDWLDQEIGFLESRGIQVIIFGPKPEFSYDIRECFARPLKSSVQTCEVSAAEVEEQQAQFRAMSKAVLARHPDAAYFEQGPLFCAGNRCRTVRNGMPLLRDPRHYSRLGSDAIIDEFVRWAEKRLPEILDKGSGGTYR